MPVSRYRRIEDMPRPWRSPNDPENLRVVAQMLTFFRSLMRAGVRRPGVQRFRSIEEAAEASRTPPTD